MTNFLGGGINFGGPMIFLNVFADRVPKSKKFWHRHSSPHKNQTRRVQVPKIVWVMYFSILVMVHIRFVPFPVHFTAFCNNVPILGHKNRYMQFQSLEGKNSYLQLSFFLDRIMGHTAPHTKKFGQYPCLACFRCMFIFFWGRMTFGGHMMNLKVFEIGCR